jgi:Ser/Thr protein kinase RdoA (MazF antagonist)
VNTPACRQKAFPIANRLADYDIGEVYDFEFLQGGMFLKPISVTSATGKYVLRAHRFRTTEEDFQFQAETLSQLGARGFRCPQVIRTRNGAWGRSHDGVFWALHEYVHGRLYTWREWLERRSDDDFLADVGMGVAKLHDALASVAPRGNSNLSKFLPPIQFRFLDDVRRQWQSDLNDLQANANLAARASREVLISRRTEIERHWEDLVKATTALHICELPRQVVHGDVSPVNIVFADGGFALIDWDCVHFGNRLYDALGDIQNRGPLELAPPAEFNAVEVQKYLAGYQNGTERQLSDLELRCVSVFCFARQLEDLRQRVAVLPTLSAANDEEYAALMERRITMMRSISKSNFKFSDIM